MACGGAGAPCPARGRGQARSAGCVPSRCIADASPRCALQEPGATVLVAGATGGVGQIATAKLLEVGAAGRHCVHWRRRWWAGMAAAPGACGRAALLLQQSGVPPASPPHTRAAAGLQGQGTVTQQGARTEAARPPEPGGVWQPGSVMFACLTCGVAPTRQRPTPPGRPGGRQACRCSMSREATPGSQLPAPDPGCWPRGRCRRRWWWRMHARPPRWPA